MSSLTGGEIYTGAWIDWSRGAIRGSTITLSDRWGSVLTAFLAFFVTIIGACLWRILCFIIHQCSASPEEKDGIHHQHQVIFRNTTSPTEAVRAFFENAFFWRKNGHNAWARSLPLSIFAFLFLAAFSAASLLTSLVTEAAGSQRLVVSDNCGFFGFDPLVDVNTRTIAMGAKDLNDTIIAATYARTCYDGGHRTNNLQCSTYTTPEIKYTTTTDAECPFEFSMCVDDQVFQLDTGFIDSHTDLGINAPPSARMAFRKVTACAPLRQDGYVEVVSSTGTDGLGEENDQIHKYQYGGYISMGLDANTTYYYNQHATIDGFGYELSSIVGYVTESAWIPIPELFRTDADVSLVFLAPNSIQFSKPNSDPFFSATTKVDLGTFNGVDASYYQADNFVNVLGCTDQYQYCDTSSPDRQCTPLTGYIQAWSSLNSTNFNPIRALIANRIALNTRALSIHHSLGGCGSSALRAQDLVHDRTQQPLPNTQWHIELNSWFSISLAKLQRAIVEYAAGPSFLAPGTYIAAPDGPIAKAMCFSQKVGVTSSTISFSVLGLCLILAIGTFIILLYLVLETAVAFIQKRLNWGDYRRVRWVMDDKMQLQRMAFEEAGMGGEWGNLCGNVPVTERGLVFGGLRGVDFDRPRLGRGWKGVGIGVGKAGGGSGSGGSRSGSESGSGSRVGSGASSVVGGGQQEQEQHGQQQTQSHMQQMPVYEPPKYAATEQQPLYHALKPSSSQGRFQEQ